MDIAKKLCDEERNFFSEIKKKCQVSCVKIFFSWSVRKLLFEILEGTKNSENMLKNGCFKKVLQWKAPIFFLNEREI